MTQTPPAVNPQAQGLDLVREVLFGAEIAALRAELKQSHDQMSLRLAALEKSTNERLAQLQTDSAQHFQRVEQSMMQNQSAGSAALTQAQREMSAAMNAQMKALMEERDAANARLAAFTAHMHEALQSLHAESK